MTLPTIPSVSLNDANSMPTLGISITDLSSAETEKTIHEALQAGYRLIDTATVYENTQAVGQAIRSSGIPRSEIFLITKLATADQGFTKATEAAQITLDQLGLEYIDLFLIHWPAPSLGLYVDSFGGLLQAKEQKLTRSIGTANFAIEHLNDVIDLVFETPVMNLVELHPFYTQPELRQFHTDHGIITGAHTPLARGELLNHPVVQSLAKEYGRDPIDILLRWNLQLGNVVVVRPTYLHSLSQPLNACEYQLSDEHMEMLTQLNCGKRILEDPYTFTGD